MLLLNENVGEILHDLELGKKFSETIAKDRSGKNNNRFKKIFKEKRKSKTKLPRTTKAQHRGRRL